MKKNKIVFNILTVIAYFYGVLLCSTMLLIPLGVYAVISAHRYADYAEYSQSQISQNKQNIKKWIVFGCVLYFPFGLIGLLCLPSLNSAVVEDVIVETPNVKTTETQPTQEPQPVEVEIHTPETESEKAEKLAKLERFKQNGLITESEFEQAKAELYGTDK